MRRRDLVVAQQVVGDNAEQVAVRPVLLAGRDEPRAQSCPPRFRCLPALTRMRSVLKSSIIARDESVLFIGRIVRVGVTRSSSVGARP